MSCYVYIDESGDTGLKKIRDDNSGGSSPYFIMGAAVMQRAATIHVNTVLNEFSSKIDKKWKHSTDLSHRQQVLLCRMAKRVNLRFFSVISNKSTLDDYAELIENEPDKFYNKCAVYLLEKVGKYLSLKGLTSESPTVVFENRNHDYDAMRRYINKIKNNPLHDEARYLRVFNPFAILNKTKEEEPLLRLADLASNAVYQCANKSLSNFSIPEPRYLSELGSKFAVDMNGKVLGAGIKCIHNIKQLELDADVQHLLTTLRGAPIHK